MQLNHIVKSLLITGLFTTSSLPLQGKITKARSPQGLTPDSFCPWQLFASYVLTLP